MIKKILLNEFVVEAENTRKLLNIIPDSILEYRPQPHLWSIAELSSHVAGIYAWYESVYLQDYLDLMTNKYEQGDISKIDNIIQKFEENVEKAKKAIENSDESTYYNNWTLKSGEIILVGPFSKIEIIRNMLCNHLYHHRGELIAYLRVTKNKVPALYGPNNEESTK
jgi:uncharacterized damage-inducible protein DinB